MELTLIFSIIEYKEYFQGRRNKKGAGAADES